MDLKNKVIWVTGGSSGIGKAAVKAFLDEGANVLITARRDELEPKYANPGTCLFVSADTTNEQQMREAAEKAVEKWGRLDGLFACAGTQTATTVMPLKPDFSKPGSLSFVPDMDANKVLTQTADRFMLGVNINLTGSYIASQIACHYMLQNDPDENMQRGCIVLVASSTAKKHTLQGYSIEYSAAKAGILGLSKEIARSGGKAGIRCNVVSPGNILTPSTDPDNPNNAPQKQFILAMGEMFEARTMLPKTPGAYTVCGKPENIASMVVEIMRNWFVNDAVIPVDGGFIGM